MENNHFLYLDKVKLVLMEWIPIGRHTIKFLQDKMECINLHRDFFVTSNVHRQRNASTVEVGESEILLRVEAYEPLEDLCFTARVDIAETGGDRQEEVIGVEITRRGRVSYGISLEERPNNPALYSVDEISHIAADLVEDSSHVMDTILNSYQKRLLDIVFCEQSSERDKFVVVAAKEISPKIKGPLDLYRNSSYRSELRQILGAPFPDMYVTTEDGCSFLMGETGILVVGQNYERYLRVLEVYGLMASVISFQNNIFNRISWSWDLLYEQKRRLSDEGIDSIIDIQATLSNLSADQGMLLAVPAHLEDAMDEISRMAADLRNTDESSTKLPFFELQELTFRRSKCRINEAHDALEALGREIENIRSLASALSEKETYGINRAMNILTVVSVIVLPLTLITGIYGMNFMRYKPPGEAFSFWNMPLLYVEHGYLIILAVMALIALSMSLYFLRQGLLFPTKKRSK